MDVTTLSAFLRDFEGRAYDVATAAGARVAKLIGDEVMFVAADPAAACVAANGLMSRVECDDDVVPRGGVAYGDVLVRGGDYYGAVVNLASRLVDEAVPGEVLVTADLVEAAPTCRFEPAGRRMMKGFTDPVQVCSLVALPTESLGVGHEHDSDTGEGGGG
jgi:adenylate cyclase